MRKRRLVLGSRLVSLRKGYCTRRQRCVLHACFSAAGSHAQPPAPRGRVPGRWGLGKATRRCGRAPPRLLSRGFTRRRSCATHLWLPRLSLRAARHARRRRGALFSSRYGTGGGGPCCARGGNGARVPRRAASAAGCAPLSRRRVRTGWEGQDVRGLQRCGRAMTRCFQDMRAACEHTANTNSTSRSCATDAHSPDGVWTAVLVRATTRIHATMLSRQRTVTSARTRPQLAAPHP